MYRLGMRLNVNLSLNQIVTLRSSFLFIPHGQIIVTRSSFQVSWSSYLLPPFFCMLDFPVQNYSGRGQMTESITLHQKVLLHQGAIDIHFPDLGR